MLNYKNIILQLTNTPMKRPFVLILALVIASLTQSLAQENVYIYPKLIVGASETDNIATPTDYSLFVTKGILTEKVRVAEKGGTAWADFVFFPDYKLRPLPSVEAFIKKNGHLPDVPNAAKIAAEGIDITETQRILLQKIEELTLYVINQDKKIKALEKALIK
jgi:hypothetical protein